MNTDIQAIYTDLGGTFRIVRENPEYQYAAKKRIAELVGTDMEPVAFHALLEERYEGYRKMVLTTTHETTDAELWTHWLAYDYPLPQVGKNAEELTYQYRRAKGERLVVDGGYEALEGLSKRGYTLGIISDLIGSREIYEWLEQDKLAHYFKAVELSSVCGIRKPNTEIYLRACRASGIDPARSAFVGDNLNRDIVGAKRAGFGLTIAVEYPDMPKLKLTEENKPDIVIRSFSEMLAIFPAAGKIDTTRVRTL